MQAGHTESTETRRGSPGKIQSEHLARRAIVYIRQSTLQQVAQHQESTRLQYALVDRAVQLGWPADQVEVIDEDLGRSGASAEGRPLRGVPGFSGWLRRSVWDRWAWCWGSRCLDWPEVAGTGISY